MSVEKTAADIWNEAIDAAAQQLEGAVNYAWNGNPRRPNNYKAAAADVRATPNPYGNQPVQARESPEWLQLVAAASNLGAAVGEFQNAKDAYTDKYPKDSSAHQ